MLFPCWKPRVGWCPHPGVAGAGLVSDFVVFDEEVGFFDQVFDEFAEGDLTVDLGVVPLGFGEVSWESDVFFDELDLAGCELDCELVAVDEEFWHFLFSLYDFVAGAGVVVRSVLGV